MLLLLLLLLLKIIIVINYTHTYSLSADGQLIVSPMTSRDVHWLTHTNPCSWMTQGVWPPWTTGLSVSAIDVYITPNKKIGRESKRVEGLIGVSYANGEVRVWRYPQQAPGAGSLILRGVASKAAIIRFSSDGQYLLALDAFYRTILQYKIIFSAK